MKFDYVASALGFCKVLHWSEDNDIEKESIFYFNECLKKIQNRNRHTTSILFNAYTEEEFGKKFHKYIKDGAHNLYGDSGGLQAVSRGFKVTPELKDKVYNIQGSYANIGFCFDAIPVEVLYAVSNQNFLGGRAFRHDLVIPGAIETARNIKRQIEVFDQMGSTCKPNVIMQGNDYDSFQQWAETICKELGDDYVARCGGMSLADTAHGMGLLDDIERCFYGSQMQVPPALMQQIHLLGVGRIRRLLPIAIMAENGFFPHTEVISYDSSTHTRQVTIGYHFMNNIMFNFGKDPSDYKLVEHDIVTKTKELFGYDINLSILRDVLIDGARSTTVETKERKSPEYIRDMIKTCASIVLVSIDNFCKTVADSMIDDNILMTAVLDSKGEFFALKQVKSVDDFHYWYNHCGKRLKTQKVQVKQEGLSSLFD